MMTNICAGFSSILAMKARQKPKLTLADVKGAVEETRAQIAHNGL